MFKNTFQSGFLSILYSLGYIILLLFSFQYLINWNRLMCSTVLKSWRFFVLQK